MLNLQTQTTVLVQVCTCKTKLQFNVYGFHHLNLCIYLKHLEGHPSYIELWLMRALLTSWMCFLLAGLGQNFSDNSNKITNPICSYSILQCYSAMLRRHKAILITVLSIQLCLVGYKNIIKLQEENGLHFNRNTENTYILELLFLI